MDEHMTDTIDKYLTLTMDNEVFALEIASVREVLDMDRITRIPKSPSHMRGVVNLRGNAVPVTDLKKKFGMGETLSTINTRIIILEVERGQGMEPVGILADSVREVFELSEGDIEPPPRMGSTVRAEYLRGVAKKDNEFVLVLELESLFEDRTATSGGKDGEEPRAA